MLLNRNRIKLAKEKNNAKKVLTKTEDDLLRELLIMGNNEYNYIKDNYSIYETCLLLESKQNSIGNKRGRLTSKYNPKEIIMVDLGVNEYGHEFSYEHPCIVIKNELTKVFVIPCTSQPAKKDKNGQIYKEYIEGFVSDGFKKDTTILISEAKFIDKTRIKSRLGVLDKKKFLEVEERLFSILLPYKSYALEKVRNDIEIILNKNNILNNENEKLKEEITILRSRFNILSTLIESNSCISEISEIKKIVDECV